MKTYDITIHTSNMYATFDVEAKTPQQALKLARKEWDTNRDSLYWNQRDDEIGSLESISVDDDTIEWFTPEVQLAMAAGDLLEAGQKVVDRWERGDLAEAVRDLAAAIKLATGGAQ
jgi:hypothetical protein